MLSDPQRVESRGGREELRAALLRPALLQLKKHRDSLTVNRILETAGVKESEIAHDSAWVPLNCARRLLEAILAELGDGALASPGEFFESSEVLGIHMRMLRHVKEPRDAYAYHVRTASEYTRVGTYAIEELEETHARLSYIPAQEVEADQAHLCFCLLRQSELRSLPRLWGLPEAQVTDTTCVARGDLCCTYQVTWQKRVPELAPWTALAMAIGSGGAFAFTGSLPASLLASTIGGACGFLLGLFLSRARRTSTTHTLEKHRILALEHGLEQRGELNNQAGDLTHSILGGKYRLLRSVGSGGIGTVYAAEHLGLGFQVAVKILRGAAAIDASEVARLRREARVQMSLEHPNIVRTFDLDQLPDGTLYVVMELLRGQSLHDQLKRHRHLPQELAIPVFLQTCRALSAAHRLGIVHRDLKPGNIFLGEGGAVKVLDFGMSKLAEEETLTQDGYTLGTPEYMSPEQCVGGAVDARTDIYAFGVLMYEALTGELPFQGKSRQALLEHHQRSAPRPLRSIRPDLDIPEELERIVMSCLKKHPFDRPQTTQQLERLLAAVPPFGTPTEEPVDTPETFSSDVPARDDPQR